MVGLVKLLVSWSWEWVQEYLKRVVLDSTPVENNNSWKGGELVQIPVELSLRKSIKIYISKMP